MDILSHVGTQIRRSFKVFTIDDKQLFLKNLKDLIIERNGNKSRPLSPDYCSSLVSCSDSLLTFFKFDR